MKMGTETSNDRSLASHQEALLLYTIDRTDMLLCLHPHMSMGVTFCIATNKQMMMTFQIGLPPR
jgi:hypothetical protein